MSKAAENPDACSRPRVRRRRFSGVGARTAATMVAALAVVAALVPVTVSSRAAAAQRQPVGWSEGAGAVAQPSRLAVFWATRLAGGKVLVNEAGAGCGASGRACFELYDPVEDRWLPVPPLVNRVHSITALEDGTALVIPRNSASAAEPAQVFNPTANTWTAVPSPYIRAFLANEALIETGVGGAGRCGDNCGKILVTGGGNDSFTHNSFDGSLKWTAELYDPITRQLTPTKSIDATRDGHLGGGAVQLADGRVLVAGGYTLQTDLYDPLTETWSAGPDMKEARGDFYWGLRLPDGRVLMGGQDGVSLFDPGTRTWPVIDPCPKAHNLFGGYCLDAELLPDGTVLGLDGTFDGATSGRATSIFDPATLKWKRIGDLQTPLRSLALLKGPAEQCGAHCGKVLGVGGDEDSAPATGFAALYGEMTDSVKVTGVSPPAGFTCGGQAVTISGTGFSGVTEVRFGDVTLPPAAFEVNSEGTAIVLKSPRHNPGDIHVRVTAKAGSKPVTSPTTPGAEYTYEPAEAATIDSLSPPLGPVFGGTAVSVGGSFAPECIRSVSFGDVPADNYGAQAAPGKLTGTITATSPAHETGRVPVRVLTDPGPPAAAGTVVTNLVGSPEVDLFSFHPVISGIFPPTGPTTGGNEVTIAGDGFANATEVLFGTDAASISRRSARELVVVAPPHATPEAVLVKVVAGGVSSLPDDVMYTYLLPQTVDPPPRVGDPGAGPGRQETPPPEVAPPGGTPGSQAPSPVPSPSPSPVQAPSPAQAPSPSPVQAPSPAQAPSPSPVQAPSPAQAPSPSPVQTPSPAQAPGQASSPAQAQAPAASAAPGAVPDEAQSATAAAARADSGAGAPSGGESLKGPTNHAMVEAQVGLGLMAAGVAACFSWVTLAGRAPSRRRRAADNLRPSRA